MIIVLVGPPGCGKGTQSALLSKELGIPALSTGDIIRIKAESRTEEGDDLRRIISEGKLAPSNLVNKAVLEYLDLHQAGCILDGYPRNLDQAEFLSNNLKQEIIVIYFDIDKEILVQRILGRFSCEKCGAIYNKSFAPTRVANKCDVCGSETFTHRVDDNEIVIRKRLDVYDNDTLPIVEYYKNLNRLHLVDAMKPVDEIKEELLSILKKR